MCAATTDFELLFTQARQAKSHIKLRVGFSPERTTATVWLHWIVSAGVIDGLVSSGASQTKTVGGRLSFFIAIGSFRLPSPKLTIRLAVSFKTRES